MPGFKQLKPIITLLLVCLGLVALLAYYFETRNNNAMELLLDDEGQTEQLEGPYTTDEMEVVDVDTTNVMNPTAVFNTNKGVIELELFADQMPITVGNFVKLAEEGYYNNTKFHRIIDGFMIQGGDPLTKDDAQAGAWGTGGPGYTIEDEFVAGELLTNKRGTIAMANTGQPNSGGSQFFINTVDNLALDFDKQPLTSKHPVFGRVIEGMDIVDIISDVETGPRDMPVEPVVIESIEIKIAEINE